MRLYLDASAILPTLVAEPASPVVDQYLGGLSPPFFLSEFAAAEVASRLSIRVRTGSLTPEAGRERLARFDGWRATSTRDVDIREADMRLAHIIVRRFELALRAPDALHLAICRRLSLTLVTLDRRLARAGQDMGVAVELLGAA